MCQVATTRRLRWPHVLVLLLCGFLAACKVELNTGLDERDANEITAVLLKNGISAHRELAKDGTMIVFVEESRFAESVEILQAHSLPRQKFSDLCSVFSGDGMISSPVEDRARLLCALSQDLSRTISEIDGVMSARVHPVLPKGEIGRSKNGPASASVLIRHHEDAPIDQLGPQIKMLVANGIEGLVYDKVSVSMVPVASPVRITDTASDFVPVAGIWVHHTSETSAKLLIYILAGGLLISLLGNGYFYWQQALRGDGRSSSAARHLPAE